MAWGKLRRSWYPGKPRAPLSLFLAMVLLAAAACAPTPTPPSSRIKTPSKVITEEGVEFSVWGLKLPGSSQELKMKQGGAKTWVPLSIIRVITFTGPEDERFRLAQIFLTSGERLSGPLFVDQIIEGTTDLGYWNMPLRDVRQVGIGEE